jgi:hypothetical protein
VERAVQYVRGNFFADETFTGLAEPQARAEAWCRDVAGMRIHGTIQARPAEVSAGQEAGMLLPLSLPYAVPVFTKVKVHRDFHVEVGRALYSAPKEYLGSHLDAARTPRWSSCSTTVSSSRLIPASSRAGG